MKKNLNDVLHGDRATVRSMHSAKTHHKKSDVWGYGYGSKGGKEYTPCYKSHPALVLPNKSLKIYGGSCSSPVVKDADVYIGFDPSMPITTRSLPWSGKQEIYLPFPDMGIPESKADFIKLVEWTAQQLEIGKKIHAGCIGGHGRTGTFLSALVAVLGELDAIEYVRAHYCKKAVESSSQIKFLADNFAVKAAKANKTYASTPVTGTIVASAPFSSGGKSIRIFRPAKAAHALW